MTRDYKIPLLATELGLYLVTILFTLMVSERLKLFAAAYPVSPAISLGQFFLFFFLATGIFLFSIRFVKSGLIWQFLFALAVFAGAQVVFSLSVPEFWAVLTALFLVIIRFVYSTVFWQNLAVMLSIAGIVSVFGLSLSPYSVVVILLVLSIYDYLAVYGTRHMVQMAQTMIHYQAVLAFIIPEKISDWQASLAQAKPGPGFVILGGGDIALPLVMLVSASLISLKHALFLIPFILGGVAFTHLVFVSQTIKRPMPALPTLALFCIFGFFLSLLVL